MLSSYCWRDGWSHAAIYLEAYAFGGSDWLNKFGPDSMCWRSGYLLKCKKTVIIGTGKRLSALPWSQQYKAQSVF